MDTGKIYEFLTNLDLHSAERLCTLLEKEQIGFELEIDDSRIRNLLPFEAALGGTYGMGTTANIYVEADAFDRCTVLLKQIR